MEVEQISLGLVNRSKTESILAGGKGINVSIVLKNLGYENVSLGFLAGFTGEEIKRRMELHGCNTDFITLSNGMSRINVKLKGKEETEINGQGPIIEDIYLSQLYEKLDQLCKEDILVLAGSIPSTLPSDIYERIMERLQSKKIRIIVDATNDLLTRVLKYHPFLINQIIMN